MPDPEPTDPIGGGTKAPPKPPRKEPAHWAALILGVAILAGIILSSEEMVSDAPIQRTGCIQVMEAKIENSCEPA